MLSAESTKLVNDQPC